MNNRFRPGYNERYFYVSDNGYANARLWKGTTVDENRYDLYNCFEFEDQANKANDAQAGFFARFHNERH